MVKQVVLAGGGNASTLHSIKHASYNAAAAGAHASHPLPGMHHTGSSSLDHHKDPFHQFEGLLMVLVFIHVAAFAFWCYLLYVSKRRKEAAAAGGSSNSSAAQKLADWRSPKDVLNAYKKKQKSQIGKG